MSINNKRSYTEYTITQPTTDFAIGFDDFDEGSKDIILVTLNGVLVETLGYAAIRKNESTVTITPAITEGTVRLTRETDIDEPFHKFTAGALFSAKSMDENFQQVRHSQQEVRDGFVFLEYNTNGIVQASKEATAQAKAATVEATASAVRAESAADTAVQAVGSLQGVVDAATTATTKANTATATATTAASQATAATTSAQNAAQAANTAKQEATTAAANANAATVDTLAATGRANEAADVIADLVVGKVRAQDVITRDGSTQADKNREHVSVKDFGAKGSGVASPVSHWHTIGATNYRGYANLAAVQADYPHVVTGNETIDWVAFVAGTKYLTSVGGGCLFVPTGKYMTNANIDIPAKVWIRGAGRGNTVVHGDDVAFHTGFTLTDQNCFLSDIFIANMDIGVYGNENTRYSKVFNCKLTGNNLGIEWHQGYINSCYGNEITFNKWGGVISGESFQFNFYDNVVDNNLGGLGLLVLGSAGAVIQNNTIEGNRIVDSGYGVGVAVFGITQRLRLDGNWFETNGLEYLTGTSTINQASCDVLLGDGVSDDAVTIINNCFPDRFKEQCLGMLSFSGSCTVSNNFHFMSHKALKVRLQGSPFSLQYHGNTFTNFGDRGAKVVDITYIVGGANDGVFNIYDNFIKVNGSTNNGALFSGINGSYVHCTKETPVGYVKYEGKDLYTKELSIADFMGLPRATISPTVRASASGNTNIRKTRKLVGGTQGAVLDGSGSTARLGNSPLLTVGSFNNMLILGSNDSKVLFNQGAGFEELPTKERDFYKVYRREGFGTGEIHLPIGDFYGYAVLTDAEVTTTLKGATRIKITDMQVVTTNEYATEIPSSSLYRYNVGDVIYNSNPVEGSAFGWVCVTAGAPAVWKSFGIIAA